MRLCVLMQVSRRRDERTYSRTINTGIEDIIGEGDNIMGSIKIRLGKYGIADIVLWDIRRVGSGISRVLNLDTEERKCQRI